MSRFINLSFSPKFLAIATEALAYKIEAMNALLDHPNTSDAALAAIDYGNDKRILEMILEDWTRKRQQAADLTTLPETLAPTKTVTPLAYYLLHQVLNEICHGPEAIAEAEFQTRIGVTKAEAVAALNDLTFEDSDLRAVDYAPKSVEYVLLKNSAENSLSVQPFAAPRASAETVLFAFRANSSNEAMAIRNKFLDFEPYVPLSENLVATRELTLYDKNKRAKSPVQVLVYQPVKVSDTEWHCEYHINGKMGNLGGRKVIGFDMVQAIHAAFFIIDTLITTFNRDHDEKIYWLEYGNDCNFLKM
jgi:hypothetical protein